MRIASRFIKFLFTSAGWWLGAGISLALCLLATQMPDSRIDAAAQRGLDAYLPWIIPAVALLASLLLYVLVGDVIADITEHEHSVAALQHSQELLRELTAHQDRMKEDERKRIAREIHDELGQTLLALRIEVSMLEARTGKSHPRLNERVRTALTHIDATVKTIRTIINDLRPAVLDLGLNAAIEWQVSEFRRSSGIRCDLVMEEKELTVDDATATSLFRVLEEALDNVLQHAHAVRILIKVSEDNGILLMKISDNGIGIDEGYRSIHNGFGLVGVEERILALGGQFMIDSAPGKGTSLTIRIPVETVDSA
jgi:signal transduction histidine kinase